MLALYIIAGLAVLGIAILAVPLDARARAEYHETLVFTSTIAWLFGLLEFTIPSGRKRPVKQKKPKPAHQKRAWGPGFRAILDILLTRGLFKQVLLLGKRAFKQLRWRDFQADVRVGLDDPADAGMLFAFIGPLTPFLPRSFVIRLQMGAAIFEGYVSGGVRIIPLFYLAIFLRFLFSLPVIKVIGKGLRLWWRNRERAGETPEYNETPGTQLA